MTAPSDPVADLARLEREMEEAWEEWLHITPSCAEEDPIYGAVERVLAARRALVAQGWRQVWVGPNEEVVEKPGDLPMAGGV
jgi:hypothetical protein